MRFKLIPSVLATILLATAVLAQVPTGTLAGKVTDGKETLPGVTVTVSSPGLQGTRNAVTEVSGDYIFRFLPPGEYRVRFELSGFQTLDTSVKVSAAQTAKLDATMPIAQVAEEVTVTGNYDTISTTQQASTTFEAGLVGKLPLLNRGINDYVAISPGVNQAGPAGAITMGGGNSFDNLFMINGVVVNENIRGQAQPLFIEDAIEETTSSISGVSAEYGRFAGGVVNSLTKSGGNNFSGSFRDTVKNNYWTQPTPLTTAANRLDENLFTYEATLGGFVLKDKLWFFAAGRQSDTSTPATARGTRIGYNTGVKDTRYEGKLTFSATPSHRLVGSYIERKQAFSNYVFSSTTDPNEVGINRSIPETLKAINYSGVITDNFFVEAQYSARTLEFVGSGATTTDRILGTTIAWPLPAWDNAYVFSHSAVFCAVCGKGETRDNKNYVVKGSWFVASPKWGSHDVRFGFDRFHDQRYSNNYQSGSGFMAGASSLRYDGTNYYPVFRSGASSLLWNPIFDLSQGTDFTTDSLFANDAWRLGTNWSFNIGVRYDKNGGTDASGRTTAKDSKISPRLGLTWDPKGNGEWLVSASMGDYVAAITGSLADSAGGGNPSAFEWLYTGPDINVTGPYVDATEAIRRIFTWYDSKGGYQGLWDSNQPYMRPPVATIPGAIVFPNGLKSNAVREYALSVSKRLGTKGMLRADLIDRTWSNFVVNRVDMGTGTVTSPLVPGVELDRAFIVNSDAGLEKTYKAFMLQGQYRLTDWLSMGGNYTLSRAYGNVAQENSGSGPILETTLQYPEYFQAAWNKPKGDLPQDQRHRARLYAVVDVLSSKHHKLSTSVMHSLISGQPYGAQGTVMVEPYVTNPGYKTPPSAVTYWFTKPDKYRLPSTQFTDVSVNYAFLLPFAGHEVQFFIEPRVSNVFNRMGVASADPSRFNNQVTTAADDDTLQSFNPFTQKPVEGVNYTFEPGPVSRTAYQNPRTFYFSFGFRF
ncbi:MAG TPA: TonB-dependent receptor [Thermoanaerobaculaceae bacterium]|nr:TonB-dependent receptor [Thermoanaerobaculaceae bacterium]